MQSILKTACKSMVEIIIQKFREIHWENSPQKLKAYRDTDKYDCREVITELCIKLIGKNHRDLLEVKVNCATESCVLLLRPYKRMFPNNLTTDG